MKIYDQNQGTLKQQAERFAGDEDGAVSVDWVVLTAAIVGVAVTAATSIQDAVGVLGSKIETEMEDTQVGS